MEPKEIIQKVKKGEFSPLYLLHGEEPFYIDVLMKAISESALEEHERDFNQTILYGKDTDVLALLSELRSYPMMAERRLVVLREAQDLKDIEKLEKYCEEPTSTTVFVCCHKHKNFDSRKKIFKSFSKNGVVYKSEKIRDYKMADWVEKFVKGLGYTITPKAATLVVENLGTDLSRVANEFEKLSAVVEKGTAINEVHIEENIGISKEYNVWELTNAITRKDLVKALKIVNYFEQNPKAANISQIIPTLFRTFSQLLKIHFIEDKSQMNIASQLGVIPFVAGDLLQTARNFDRRKLAGNIALLNEFDLKSKGVGNSGTSGNELLRELTFKLMH